METAKKQIAESCKFPQEFLEFMKELIKNLTDVKKISEE